MFNEKLLSRFKTCNRSLFCHAYYLADTGQAGRLRVKEHHALIVDSHRISNHLPTQKDLFVFNSMDTKRARNKQVGGWRRRRCDEVAIYEYQHSKSRAAGPAT